MATDDTPTMFPELDTTRPEQKKLLADAKKYGKMLAARAVLMKDDKEKCDTQMGKVIEGMHACKITKFKHGDVKVELNPGKEKVTVKLDDEEAEPDEDASDE